MEFEEMRKIWDAQNNEPIYVLNEQALHKIILAKKNHFSMIANINELGLMVIAVLTSSYLIYKNLNESNIYAYFPAIAILLTGVYVAYLRIRRKNKKNQFEHSILGDLDHAISNADYQVTFARTFVWWYILPIAIPLVINMAMNDTPLWKWIFVPVSLFVSYLVVNYELQKYHIPRKSKLKKLREKLLEEVNTDRNK